MVSLNLDILFDIIEQAKSFPREERQKLLSSLALTSRELNKVIRSNIFHTVRWPPSIFSESHDTGALTFLPDGVLHYIRDFHLEWPEGWPEGRQGLVDKLVATSLPKMTNLRVFQTTGACPLSISLLALLARQDNVKDLRMVDTPLVALSQPLSNANFERLTLVPVAEAMRAGEGPFRTKFREFQSFAQPYRRHLPNIIAASQYLFDMGLAPNLKYLQVSTEYLTAVHALALVIWPQLETLVLTGPTKPFNLPSMALVVAKMPRLSDLRLLMSKGDPAVRSPVSGNGPSFDSRIFSNLRRLSLSNAFEIHDLLRQARLVEHLSIGAFSRHPQIPIAMSSRELHKALQVLEAGGCNTHLKTIRLISEDHLKVHLFKTLWTVCPNLEFMEVEVCGYQDRGSNFSWTDYADILCKFDYLQELRIGIGFPRCREPCKDHQDPAACIREGRRNCAIRFATRIPTLRFIGFEYWTRTGSYRGEDRWLDYEIIRLGNGGISVVELVQTWYPFPEVWERAEWQG